MNNESNGTPIDPQLEASLKRLGIHELEERLELAPLLAGGGLEDAEGCRCSCDCDYDPEEGIIPRVQESMPMPDATGMGNNYGPW